MTQYTIRPIRAHEWREVRDLRLTGLQDEAAPMAFVTSYEDEAAQPDSFWQDRARGSSIDAGATATARQFVAISEDGAWVGTVVLLVEKAGDRDWEGSVIEHTGGHVVGVFVLPEHRGTGLLGDLLDAALEWAREIGLERVRLYAHRDNGRAQAAYRKTGFEATGVTMTGSIGPEIEMARMIVA
jgi:GNAT superfamily N-acetyltransferase